MKKKNKLLKMNEVFRVFILSSLFCLVYLFCLVCDLLRVVGLLLLSFQKPFRIHLVEFCQLCISISNKNNKKKNRNKNSKNKNLVQEYEEYDVISEYSKAMKCWHFYNKCKHIMEDEQHFSFYNL